MATPSGVYPLATPGGEAIPFDIIKPISLAVQAVSSSASSSVVLPSETTVVLLLTTVDTYARLGSDITAAPTLGTFYSNMIFLPANIVVSTLLSAATLYFRSVADSGNVQVQLAEKWNSLGIAYQYGVR